jgi:erythromycin esterase
VKADTAAKSVDLKLDLPVESVVGKIMAANGQVPRAAKVIFTRVTHQEGNTYWAEVKGGSYSLALPAGEYLVSAQATGAVNYWKRLTVKPGTSRFDLHLQPTPIPANAKVKAWIKENLIPLKTCEPGKGFEDLQPLKSIVGDARVVALGEATHGTREFFKMKHRMFEFLVEKMGFNLFVIEAT